LSEHPGKKTETPAGGMAFERPIQELEAQLSELEALSLRTQLDITSEIEALRSRLKVAIETT
jgi:acetyl-CoA carboxylase alpha subunit